MKTAVNALLPVFALLAAAALWGSSFVAIKYGVGAMHPAQMLFGRMLVGCCCFLPFAGSIRRMPLTRAHAPLLLLMCLCEPCLYLACEVEALMYTSASQASMISTMLPVMTALGAGLFLGERLGARLLAGFALAAAGAIWLGLADEGGDAASPSPLLGNFLELVAMSCGAAGTLAVKRLSRRFSAFHLTALQTLSGLVFFGALMLLPSVRQAAPLTASSVLVIAYLGVACNFGAYSLYNFGVSRIPASRATAFVNLIPVFAVALGVMLLGERLNLAQCLACAAVLVGVWLTRKEGNK